ncbi:MAG: minichromosome maintenance protein MCM [Thermoplasmata archaeon YP2-bin.285]|uniref:DNA helicase n=1 Tax=Candidatus Sysuiplasma superficiale TaxID=2823368 RepID=A0A8J8CFE9_9ARCH|nr:minichromosome maintenance protein MCM [Candidatus Sysuiplasma superficiale]
MQYNEEALINKWDEFFHETGLGSQIMILADRYPEEKSLTVQFSILERFDADFATFLLEEPSRSFEAAQKAIRNQLAPERQNVNLNFRVTGLPVDSHIDIRNLRSKHLGKFVCVEGLVRKVTEVRPRLQKAAFRCVRCNEISWVEQEGMLQKEPLECSGCGKSAGATKFVLVTEQSTYIDTQKIEVQEPPEGLRGGAQPERLEGYLIDDITGRISPGDRVILNGILTGTQKTGPQGKSTLFNIMLQVNSAEYREHEYDEIQITPEDIENIRRVAASGDVLKQIASSISPTIYGFDVEKVAFTLQLFSGVSKEMQDGTRIRGDIHILLVGDPGLAKSQLLRYMSELAPRGIYASGKSSSAAGLTAAAVKDEFGEGRWTLEAGALVLADKGIACVDELDKMTDYDRSAMHQIMESQIITVAKAGITATLQARCSILGAANPRYGRFEDEQLIADQIDLPPALLSRFDLIFVLKDRPNSAVDRNIADHILRAHRVGERRKVLDLPQGISEEKVEQESRSVEPRFDRQFLRKYISYAKRINPVLTDGAIKIIEEEYLRIRKMGEAKGASIPITARQLEAYVRLSEASARGRLSETVEIEDAERAIEIVWHYLSKVTGGDIDKIAGEMSHSQRTHVSVILDIVRQGASGGVSIEEIVAGSEKYNISEEETRRLIEKLSKAGELFEVRNGIYRIVSQK